MTIYRKLNVFLIYADENTIVAAEVCNKLKDEGWIEPWLDKYNILPGQNWELETNNALERADAVIVLLSTLSIKKESHVQVEIRKALEIADQKPDGIIFFIPIRLENCVVPSKIKKWHWIDYFSDKKVAYGKIVESLVTRASSIGIEIHTRMAMMEEFKDILLNRYSEGVILFLLGGSGIGKTYFLQQMLQVSKSESRYSVINTPIDLYSTDSQSIGDIQLKIEGIIDEFSVMNGESNPFIGWDEDKIDSNEKFYERLKTFCRKYPIILAFDNFEDLNKITSDWIFKGGPGGLQVPGLICIVASRYEKEDLVIYRKNFLVKEMHISGLTVKEAEELFSRIAKEGVENLDDLLKEAEVIRDNIIENSIDWVVQITEGHPLRLEMVFRWLGTLLGNESLNELTIDKFEEHLMAQVRELAERGQLDAGADKQISQPIYDTLLCMAYITHRFDEKFLQYFIDQKLISLGDTKVTKTDIIDSLEKYFFIKVRQGNMDHYILQLHDEMARLMRDYIWPFVDSSGTKRSDLYQATIKLYDILIDRSTEKLKDVLENERLYYIHQRSVRTIGGAN